MVVGNSKLNNQVFYIEVFKTYKILENKAYNTRYSQPVAHASTNRARRCLTSEIGCFQRGMVVGEDRLNNIVFYIEVFKTYKILLNEAYNTRYFKLVTHASTNRA